MLASQAVQATPDDHRYQARRLAFLAQTLCYLPSVTKLEQADVDLTQATSHLRHDDPDRAWSCRTTGRSWMRSPASSGTPAQSRAAARLKLSA